MFDTHEVNSAAGVQQGDPLGPLIFAAAIQPLALRLKELVVQGAKLDLVAFYLDDGVIAGDQYVVETALSIILEEADRLNLKLNLAKNELITPRDTEPVVVSRVE